MKKIFFWSIVPQNENVWGAIMSDLKTEMKAAAEKINHIIRNDSFPETIRPEELRTAVRTYPSMGGKRLRPILLLWTCGLFNGDPDTALPAAAAVEIYHNWTLVHDDIIDCDDFRRGVPTSHTEIACYASGVFHANETVAAKFGKDLAILAGDVQHAWAVNMLLRLTENGVAPGLVIQLCRRMQEVLNRELISGEALDVELALREIGSVDENSVLRMISGKTCALLTFCVQCGAAIAAGKADFESPEQLALAEFAEKLGLAYQLQDDLLGVYGEIEQFGKPPCSDFKECKPTLLYLEAKKRLTGENAKLLETLTGQPFYSSEMVEIIKKLLTDCGAEDAVRQREKALTDEALAALRNLPDNPYREKLIALTEYLMKRNI